MTTREEAIHACLIDSSVYPDTPFHDANWTIIRHQENQKMFAAVYQRKGQTWMNVKVEPLSPEDFVGRCCSFSKKVELTITFLCASFSGIF